MEQSVQTINIVFLTIGVVLSSTMLVSFFVSPNIMLIAMSIYFIVYSLFILSYLHRHRGKLAEQSGMHGNIVMYATIYNIMISGLIVLLVVFFSKKPSNSSGSQPTTIPANVFKRPVFYV